PPAVVLIAPLVPGSREVRRLVLGARSLGALIVGGHVPPPAGRARAAWIDLPDPARAELAGGLAPDDAAVVRDVVWGRVRPAPPGRVPVLVIAGGRDALLLPAGARTLADTVAAELQVLESAGHWPFLGASWQKA